MSTQKPTVIGNDSVQCTEQEIIRVVAETINIKFRERATGTQSFHSNVQSHNFNDAFSEERSMVTQASYKTVDSPARMCYRIWSGYTKFIRQQCRKERVCDSQLFGVFSKKPSENDDEDNAQYLFHPDKNHPCFPDFLCVSSGDNNGIP